MLYTDAAFVAEADILKFDKDVARVALAESITLADVIAVAMSECGNLIQSDLQQFGSFGSAGMSGGHLAAVLNVGWSTAIARARLGNIVVHSMQPGLFSPIQTWTIHKILQRFYLEASSRKKEIDRYLDKMDLYEDRARESWRNLFGTGLPAVTLPLPCPGAIYEYNSGTWSAANLSSVAGGAEAETTINVAITYTGAQYVAAGQKNNSESSISGTVALQVPANKFLKIDIASLVPPVGASAVGIPQGSWVNIKATGWNVYAAVAGQELRLQNASPIAIATKTYEFDGLPSTDGPRPDLGQNPDTVILFHRTLNRA